MMNDAVAAAIVAGDETDVFAYLGMHRTGSFTRITVFDPHADRIELLDDKADDAVAILRRDHPGGLFTCRLPTAQTPVHYRLRVLTGDGIVVRDDPYCFPSVIDERDAWLFGEGNHTRAWRFMGAHLREFEGVSGCSFVVWAPNAKRVSVVGEFNRWDGRMHVMRRHPANGLWDLFIPDVGEGALYRFEVKTRAGQVVAKADPYARAALHPADTVAVITNSRHVWHDDAWMAGRRESQRHDRPLSIYEVHAGSWKRDPGGGHLGYASLGEKLFDYVNALGFTHIQLMPMSEHPFEGSWGYQPIGLFAPTCRYGSPDSFRQFIDAAHARGIGVLLDWVPGHFPRDEHGLGRFDGTALYEHEDPRKGWHPDWDTYIYNFGRPEVVEFLLSNALYWLGEFHLDGLRVDAVASMLYLDYSRNEGEWLPNERGGRENLEAIAFLRRLAVVVGQHHPDALLIAEESTAWPGVTTPVHDGGLGFDYKWNLGWMHDTLDYMRRDPIHRRHHHDRMTFGLLYAFSENFILPLSHDEVVHGKSSLLSKMPDGDWQMFANLRAYLGFMWAHPGKKLLFMGGEFGQRREWNHGAELEWHLLDFAPHAGVRTLVTDLNRLYRAHPALHRADTDPAGFEWTDANDRDHSVFSFLRREPGGQGEEILVVANMTPVVRREYEVRVRARGDYIEILNTDSEHYGGSNVGNLGRISSRTRRGVTMLSMTLPPLGTVYFLRESARVSH